MKVPVKGPNAEVLEVLNKTNNRYFISITQQHMLDHAYTHMTIHRDGNFKIPKWLYVCLFLWFISLF